MKMNIQNQIRENSYKSWAIMVFFMGFVSLIGYLVGKMTGMGNAATLMALLFSTFSAFISYYFGDRMVLSISRAKPVSKSLEPELYSVVETLAKQAEIPMPALYVIEESAGNAFATGRDPKHASVAVTRGLMGMLTKQELSGVIAHELSHVRNGDIKVMAIVTVLVGTAVYLSDFALRSFMFGSHRDREDRDGGSIVFIIGILLTILAPLLATLVQLAVSRRREYLADASGAFLTRKPESLASALEKISHDRQKLAVATNATAHLFIANPFKGTDVGGFLSGLFDTHPPIAERVKLLRSM
jgi:heat shock protein HtpX